MHKEGLTIHSPELWKQQETWLSASGVHILRAALCARCSIKDSKYVSHLIQTPML